MPWFDLLFYFDLRNTTEVTAFGLGILLLGPFSARHFGRFHGGNLPERA